MDMPTEPTETKIGAPQSESATPPPEQSATPPPKPDKKAEQPTPPAGKTNPEPLVALKSSGLNFLAQFNRKLTGVALWGAILVVLVAGFRSWERAQAGLDYASIFNLIFVAAAAFGLGGLAGFIFGAAGEEKQSFSGMATALNGIIGGFALSDITKKDGVIREVLHSLAVACELPGSGLVACVLVFFGAAGFVVLYVNKQYVLNPAMTKNQQMAEQNQHLATLTRSVKVSLADIGSQPTTEPKVVDGIKASLKDFEAAAQKDPELGDLFSAETLRSYAKAYYVTGELNKAESMLRRARSLSPDDPDALFYLAHVLITAQRPLESIPYLAFLSALPNAPVLTWKLLGYACLFDSNRLDEAERATDKYLCFAPNDAGALLNLACVHGQRGPVGAVNVTLVMNLLKQAIQIEPAVRAKVKDELTQPGGDFEAWKDNPDFQKL